MYSETYVIERGTLTHKCILMWSMRVWTQQLLCYLIHNYLQKSTAHLYCYRQTFSSYDLSLGTTDLRTTSARSQSARMPHTILKRVTADIESRTPIRSALKMRAVMTDKTFPTSNWKRTFKNVLRHGYLFVFFFRFVTFVDFHRFPYIKTKYQRTASKRDFSQHAAHMT